jgi:MFS family permease
VPGTTASESLSEARRADGQGDELASRAASVSSTVGHEATSALLPGFLAGTLATTPAALGIIEGVAVAVEGAARAAGGVLADNRRRRVINAAGYAGTAILGGLIGATGSAPQAGLLRVGELTSRGARSPIRYAQVSDRVPAPVYGRAFGLERTLRHLGAIGGPLLAILLLWATGIRAALLLAAIPGLAAVAIALWLGRRSTPPPADAAARLPLGAVARGPLGRLLAGVVLFECGNFAATLLILRATRLLEPGRSGDEAITLALALYLLFGAAAAAVALPAGWLCDRRGALGPLAVGVLCLLGAYAGFAYAGNDPALLGGCFALAGAAIGCVELAEFTGVARFAPETMRGSAFGYLAATKSVGKLVASVVAGTLWTLVAPEAGLLWAAPLMLASALALGVSAHQVRPPPAGPEPPP